ncbi:unnamed protein product [Echinostoma caproni]|uniref:Large ribosomal subunit protein eL6 n=1 Tax=Echinostoma caproni TaxID=27848 RepID=A0A183ASF1_9TREM|nr:unnamed protein product [Echinostoma caproni]
MSEVEEAKVGVEKALKRRKISGKRFLEHKKFLQRINRRLKAKGEPRAKGRKPVGKSKTVETQPKRRFPRSYVVQQGKSKLRLRKTKCYSDHIRRIRPTLVPGPFKYNGVPMRRVNQRYVIATATRVDLSKVEIPKRVNDEYFRRMDLKEHKEPTEKFLVEETKKYSVSDERKEDQKIVDKQVTAAIKNHPESKLLHAYLRSLFSLGKRDYPHRMIF